MRSVRFVSTHDDRSLAWSRSGKGVPLVKAAAWLTHLEHDAESPVWAHWVAFFEKHYDYLRYDERGCGLSDRDPGALELDSWIDDLERVVAASEINRPFVLLAMSQGTGAALGFAARHPEMVSHLILVGGYARGPYHRGDAKAAELYRAIVDVFGAGFDQDNPAFIEVFTKRFLPLGDAEKIGWFNDLCRRAVDAETGARLLQARGEMDASHLLGEVRCPTLVLHARDDGVVPLSEGRYLAQGISGAEFRVVDSANHILQVDEPAWDESCRAILEFTGAGGAVGDGFDLTRREQAVLAEICAAKSNKQIARDLKMSEKTVRNHATRIFAKLGVSSRQEAILKVKGG